LLQRRVAYEPDFRGRIPDAAHHQLLLGCHTSGLGSCSGDLPRF
jgi:hypothetical protein